MRCSGLYGPMLRGSVTENSLLSTYCSGVRQQQAESTEIL